MMGPGGRGSHTHTADVNSTQLISLLVICRPSGCTVVSGIVVVIIIVVGVCNRCQMKTTKWTCLIFGVSIDLDPG